jgi:ribosomal protein L11 methyltransferase
MYELVLRAPQALVEPVSDALVDELAALSVSVEDADAGSDAEQALFGEPGMPAPRPGWRRSTLHALFADETAAAEAAALLLAQDWAAGLEVQTLQPLPDQDWVRLTQSQFEPVAIADGFWVVPSWHAVPADARRVIRLDPGLAFGTGTHPTTRMCLRWLATQAAALSAPDARVLDYGCGSGILAIGAALHGAADIDAVDIDPAAVQATEANALANGVMLRAGLPERAVGHYSVVLANILATPLTLLAPLLCDRLRPGGQLVLAGILERQAEELSAAYAPWLALQVSDAQDGWILMTGHRAAAPQPTSR